MSKVLYVCYFAHHTGHPPFAAMYEPKALTDNGADVTLLTFCGLREGCTPKVKHIAVFDKDKHKTLDNLFNKMRSNTLTQWILRIIEVNSTLNKAIGLRNQYDVIHLRDIEPFPFIAHFYALCHKTKWLASVMGGNLSVTDSSKEIAKGKLMPLYRGLFNGIVNNKIWRLLYKCNRHKFTYITQDNQTNQSHKPIFGDNIHTIPMGAYDKDDKVDKIKARDLLGIPHDKKVLLLFGVPHAGKNSDIVFKALAGLKDYYLLCAGDSSMSLGDKPLALAKKYNLYNVKICDTFISESDKELYFKAADLSILSYTKKFNSTSSMLWESCAYKLPVISSDANTLGELVKDNDVGFTFEAENADDLKKVLLNINFYDIVSKAINCPKFTDKYSWDKWAKEVIKLYA